MSLKMVFENAYANVTPWAALHILVPLIVSSISERLPTQSPLLTHSFRKIRRPFKGPGCHTTTTTTTTNQNS